jgi:putative nucleotidyltransferase with HDIG domain
VGVDSPLRSQSLAGIRALARAIDHKDAATAGHSDGVAAMAGALAAELGWPGPEIERLELAALVHDVGKMGVPDGTLLKPSLLTSAERSHVQLHAALGAQIAAEVLAADQVAWVRSHHERIDGTGYPDGLAGDAIPLGARIVAVADAWDVMTSGRPYAAALDTADALGECLRVAGSQLDVVVVDALVRVLQARHRGERDIA